jgi:hypothetical protein
VDAPCQSAVGVFLDARISCVEKIMRANDWRENETKRTLTLGDDDQAKKNSEGPLPEKHPHEEIGIHLPALVAKDWAGWRARR